MAPTQKELTATVGALPAGNTLAAVRDAVWGVAQDFLRATDYTIEGLTPDTPLMDAGLDSLDMLKLAR